MLWLFKGERVKEGTQKRIWMTGRKTWGKRTKKKK